MKLETTCSNCVLRWAAWDSGPRDAWEEGYDLRGSRSFSTVNRDDHLEGMPVFTDHIKLAVPYPQKSHCYWLYPPDCWLDPFFGDPNLKDHMRNWLVSGLQRPGFWKIRSPCSKWRNHPSHQGTPKSKWQCVKTHGNPFCSHQNSWDKMDVHPIKNGIYIGIDPYPSHPAHDIKCVSTHGDLMWLGDLPWRNQVEIACATWGSTPSSRGSPEIFSIVGGSFCGKQIRWFWGSNVRKWRVFGGQTWDFVVINDKYHFLLVKHQFFRG